MTGTWHQQMKTQGKGNDDEGEEREEDDEKLGHTGEHDEVDANCREVSKDDHDIHPDQGYHNAAKLMDCISIHS